LAAAWQLARSKERARYRSLSWNRRHMKFRDFIRILVRHGFELDRARGSHRVYRGSHRVYKGRVRGRTRLVIVACHSETDDIKPGTLASMIRQSGLPKGTFRG
jgi:predicted RNA binding protein YcfA (HicA-like mRNA interferase family)